MRLEAEKAEDNSMNECVRGAEVQKRSSGPVEGKDALKTEISSAEAASVGEIEDAAPVDPAQRKRG